MRHILVGVFAIGIAVAVAVPRATSSDTDRFTTYGISFEHPSAWSARVAAGCDRLRVPKGPMRSPDQLI